MRMARNARYTLRCTLTALLVAAAARADTTVAVRPDRPQAEWDGWGVSLCWWANQFGARADLADVLFTARTVNLTTDSGMYQLPGLGLNIARYNIGGTSTEPSAGEQPNNPPNLPAFRRIEGFWLNGNSDDPSSASFRWSADANQRAMLRMARDRGADQLEAFSNSPMWWMCRNLSTAGGDGGGDNLRPESVRLFARYLAIVAQYARSQWGVSFDHIEPFNEPSVWWWRYPSGQEGCHFDLPTQQQVIACLREELDSRGLQSVAISASDENSMDDALRTWNALDAAIKAKVARVNVHGYSGQRAYRGSKRGALSQAMSASGRPLWDSEYGEADGSGLTMARSIALDINEARVSGWCYWQPFDSGGWGLVQSNPGDNWIGPPNPKFYVMAQYSRHIRPGMVLLESADPNTVAAYDPNRRRLVLVTVNGPEGQWIDYDLSRFGAARGPIARWTTGTGTGDGYVRGTDCELKGGAFRSWFEPDTVQTFEVSNVSLAVPALTGGDLRRALSALGARGESPLTAGPMRTGIGAIGPLVTLPEAARMAREVAGLQANG